MRQPPQGWVGSAPIYPPCQSWCRNADCALAHRRSARGQRLQRRRPVYLTPQPQNRLELGRDAVEDAAQIGADKLERGNRSHRDQGGNQAVLDRSRAALVPEELHKRGAHVGLSPLVSRFNRATIGRRAVEKRLNRPASALLI